jgi:hypothetical protein
MIEGLNRTELKMLSAALDLLRNQMRQEVQDGWTDPEEYDQAVLLQGKVIEHLAALPW